MLRTRVITAVVLLALLISALRAPATWPFAVLTLVLIAAAGWEWGRLNQAGTRLSLVFAAALGAACAAALQLGWTADAPAPVWWAAAALWAGGAALALRAGPQAWATLPRGLRWAIGLVVLWAAWLALSRARDIGVNFVLSVFCLVWVADIAAYFGGRTFGKRKLALSISPGKTWEGVWSGMLGVLLLAVAWHLADGAWSPDSPSLYTQLLGRVGVAGAALALLLLAGMSVVGDLVESLVKRAAGMKDSSRLLPGHGGVLDRVDALLPVFPIALALAGL